MRPRHLGAMAALVAVGGCTRGEDDTASDPTRVGGGGGVELTMPDLSDVDLDAAFAEAITVVSTVSGSTAWSGHSRALARRHAGCPDFYVGAPEDFADDFNIPEDGGEGTIWYDNCTTPGGLFYRGMVFWDGRGSISGDATTSAGRTETGTRRMAGSGTIGDATDTMFQFRGEMSDSLSRVVAPDYERWTYSSRVSATVTGSDALDPIASPTPGGYRADIYLSASGNEAPQLEARGDIYLFDHRIAGRFDSVAIDIELVSEAAAGPGVCWKEPKGWIGIRDENAWWIDVVFMPAETEYAGTDIWYDPSYSDCDGCGTVYVRGVEGGAAEVIGEVCPDFQAIWDRGVLPLPEIEDYVFTVRSLDEQD